jgi:hypothetical protein
LKILDQISSEASSKGNALGAVSKWNRRSEVASFFSFEVSGLVPKNIELSCSGQRGRVFNTNAVAGSCEGPMQFLQDTRPISCFSSLETSNVDCDSHFQFRYAVYTKDISESRHLNKSTVKQKEGRLFFSFSPFLLSPTTFPNSTSGRELTPPQTGTRSAC